jgi:hypothetical protein
MCAFPVPCAAQVLSGPRRGDDDAKSLHAVRFQTGDYLDVAIYG